MVTITSDDEREKRGLDVDLEQGAKRLVLADTAGWEYHFGRGPFTPLGTFSHVATYSPEGREPYAWWWQVLDGAERGWTVREEPELGPTVTALAVAALEDLARRCNQNNGFYADPEKSWAVETLRALWEEEPYDSDEIAVWAATHGWGIKYSNKLRELAEGVRQRTQFRDYARRSIKRDRAKEQRMVAHWREQL
jgi:hypothetical protein